MKQFTISSDGGAWLSWSAVFRTETDTSYGVMVDVAPY